MERELKIKDQNKNEVNAKLITLSEKHIDKILKLQDEIIDNLEDKDIFAKTYKDEFVEIIRNSGEVIGITVDDELIAFGAMIKPDENEMNLGYDINLCKEELLEVAHIESTVVSSEYRGNGLQKLLCKSLEDIGKGKGCTIFCATVAPTNKFSLNTLLSLDYKIELEKEKYGGVKRYIVMKR